MVVKIFAVKMAAFFFSLSLCQTTPQDTHIIAVAQDINL